MRGYGLRDGQWERTRGLLPGRHGTVGEDALDDRLLIEAIPHRYRAGIPWRDLPDHLGDRKNVHRRFSRWAKSGVWQRGFQVPAARRTTNMR